MLMPGRVEGWPAGTQRAANPAQRLLSRAVGWWDASFYREGDRFLRNRGTGRELLDLRLGSSFTANSNDPQYLPAEDVGYAYLTGSGNTLSVPSEVALDTADLDIRMLVALDQYTPGSTVSLAQRVSGSTGWQLRLLNTSRLNIIIWTSGGTSLNLSSSATASNLMSAKSEDGKPIWLRVTFDADDGAGSYILRWYTSADGTTWTQLGGDLSSAAVTIAHATSSALVAAANGKVYRLQQLDGIGGTTVLDIDCDAITSGSATSFTAVTNQTVTITRSTSGRKSVAMPSRWNGGRACFLLGTDDFLQVQDTWQHQLLKTDLGDALTVVLVSREWGTPSFAPLIAKQDNVQAQWIGWTLFSNGTNVHFYQSDGAVTVSPGATFSYGATRVAVGRRFPVERVSQMRTEASTSPVPATSAQATINSPSQRLTVGKSSTAPGYSHYEFTAAAVFRRALTADEIATISRHYTGA